MKTTPPDLFRLTTHLAARLKLPAQLVSDETAGMNGFFLVPHCGVMLRCMASDGVLGAEEGLDPKLTEWEHVSVSTVNRCPTWAEMCFVKGLFWGETECVIQFHPPKSEYVNNHPYCLHLWRAKGADVPTPPSILVGFKGVTLR